MTSATDGLRAQAPWNPTSASRGNASVEDAAKGALDKDAFMKLLVAQLANQDPMSPTDPSQFVAQLSQFSSLEQLVNLKEGMDLLAVTEAAGTSAQMVSFIGKGVQFGDAAIPWKAGAQPITTHYELAESAAEVTVRITDSVGNTVDERKLGAQAGGEHTFVFDGKKADGSKLPAGSYRVVVTAVDADDASVSLKQWSEGVVAGVTFEAGYPQLMLADGRTLGLAEVFEVGSGTTTDDSQDNTETDE